MNDILSVANGNGVADNEDPGQVFITGFTFSMQASFCPLRGCKKLPDWQLPRTGG